MIIFLSGLVTVVPQCPENLLSVLSQGVGELLLINQTVQSLFEVDPERRIEINWDEKFSGQLPTTIQIKCEDKPGILSNLTKLISNSDVNISKVEMNQTGAGHAVGNFRH